jgi:hypothetical protein
MTLEQAAVLAEHPGISLVAHCAGRSRSLIVRFAGDRRLFYLSPAGLFRRCQ